ncbi:MAG: hypothetical protein IPL12_21515 [Bacteroidetes bacterium]|nr:hypothetical protein [Bacteroidota bacterium]
MQQKQQQNQKLKLTKKKISRNKKNQIRTCRKTEFKDKNDDAFIDFEEEIIARKLKKNSRRQNRKTLFLPE